jgi:hypothetical protein
MKKILLILLALSGFSQGGLIYLNHIRPPNNPNRGEVIFAGHTSFNGFQRYYFSRYGISKYHLHNGRLGDRGWFEYGGRRYVFGVQAWPTEDDPWFDLSIHIHSSSALAPPVTRITPSTRSVNEGQRVTMHVYTNQYKNQHLWLKYFGSAGNGGDITPIWDVWIDGNGNGWFDVWTKTDAVYDPDETLGIGVYNHWNRLNHQGLAGSGTIYVRDVLSPLRGKITLPKLVLESKSTRSSIISIKADFTKVGSKGVIRY